MVTGTLWEVTSQAYTLEVEKPILSWLRVRVHGRFYNQSGALFWSDDYTGGEPETGPRGQYWSGDRELSPLASYLLGGRFGAEWRGQADNRVLGFLLKLRASASFGPAFHGPQGFHPRRGSPRRYSGAYHGFGSVRGILTLAQSVFSCQIRQILAIHLGFPCRLADVVLVSLQQPLHVVSFEACLELRSSLAVGFVR